MSDRYPFRYYDDTTRSWKRARFRAPLEEIERRYQRFELLAPPWTSRGMRIPEVTTIDFEDGVQQKCSIAPSDSASQ